MRLVYFIRAAGVQASPVKIGCSTAPELRKAALETWHPYPLEVAAQMVGSFELERRFHALFARQHTHGEWFAWTPDIDEVIADVQAGIFNIDDLPPPVDVRWKGARPRQRMTEEAKAQRRADNARWKAYHATHERTGLFMAGFDYSPEKMDAFIADPVRHGVTPEVHAKRMDAHRRRHVDALFGEAA